MKKVNYLGTILGLWMVSAQAATYGLTEVDMMIDERVDPCNDFYQYACGGWLQRQDSSSYQHSYTFSTINAHNHDLLSDFYNQDKSILGVLFQSCTNVERLNQIGTEPIEAMRARIAAVKNKHELFVLAGELSLQGLNFLTTVGSEPDPKAAWRNIFTMGQADLTLGDPSYYTDQNTWIKYRGAYRTYVTTIFTLIGYDFTPAVELTEKVVRQEHQIAASYVPQDETNDPMTKIKNNRMIVKEAMAKYPNVCGAFLKGANVLATTNLKEGDTMVFVTPLRYFDDIENVIQSTHLNSLKALLEFQYINHVSQYMGQRFMAARFKLYDQALRGQNAPTLREDMCADVVKKSFPALVGKFYVSARFDKGREAKARDLIKLIEDRMATRINKSLWLDQQTRQRALDKLASVTNLIGHAEHVENFDGNALNIEEYFANLEAINRFKVREKLDRINNPVDRTKWTLSAADVNAYYEPSENKMVFPAGILQPPVFSHSHLPAQNFGAIGVIMGHELAHAFDNTGRRYDGHGNIVDWWKETTHAKFEKRAQCFIDQYNQFQLRSETKPHKIIGKVNGMLTLGENMADTVGLALAFDALNEFRREVLERQHPVGSPPDLPWDYLNRLFFLSFAQSSCTKFSKPAEHEILKAVHTHPRFRVIGSLQNNQDFSNAFNCKAGSYMNPRNKCQVW